MEVCGVGYTDPPENSLILFSQQQLVVQNLQGSGFRVWSSENISLCVDEKNSSCSIFGSNQFRVWVTEKHPFVRSRAETRHPAFPDPISAGCRVSPENVLLFVDQEQFVIEKIQVRAQLRSRRDIRGHLYRFRQPFVKSQFPNESRQRSREVTILTSPS